MIFGTVRHAIGIIVALGFSNLMFCEGQYSYIQFKSYDPTTSTPLPFPACRADNIDCLRRGLRTFFFLMESGQLGMKPIDPIIINSVTVALPNEQMSFLMRRANVTGAKWSKLIDRKFNLPGGKNSVRFSSNLHVTGEIIMSMAGRVDPYITQITMDLYEVESNVTYAITGLRGYDNEDYIHLGSERVAVRNSRLPTFFVASDSSRAEIKTNSTDNTEDSYMVDKVLSSSGTILDHISCEIAIAVMHSVVDNFRIFASKVPVKNYYTYDNK